MAWFVDLFIEAKIKAGDNHNFVMLSREKVSKHKHRLPQCKMTADGRYHRYIRIENKLFNISKKYFLILETH